MLKAITFDLWTTILEPVDYTEARIEYMRPVLERSGYSVDDESLRAAYAFALGKFYDVWQNEHRHMPSYRRLGLMLAQLNAELSQEMFSKIVKYCEETVLYDPPPLIQDAENVLDSLNRSYKIGLICDSGMSPGRVMREVLKLYGILPYFSATVFSDELGYTKPHPCMFRTALDQLGVEPHQALHIGDLLKTDVAGAKAAGMKAVWFNRDGAKIDDASITPNFEIRRLSDIIQIVEEEKAT